MDNKVKDYIDKGLSVKEISELLNVSVRKVHYIANKQGLHFERQSKFNIDYDRFTGKLHTQESYYLLGYLYADGTINIKKGQISITSKDKEILYKLSYLIGNLPIKEYKKGYFNLSWYSMKHIKELISLGCMENKSLILTFPTFLQKELIPHFIRGYFDGDGTIGFYKHRKKGVLRLSVVGTKNFLEGINTFFQNRYRVKKVNNQNIYILSLNGNNIVKDFCKIIYKDANIYMKRKYDIYYDKIKL